MGRQEWGVRWGDRRRVLGGGEATVSHPAAQSIPTPALHNKHTAGEELSMKGRNFTVKARTRRRPDIV